MIVNESETDQAQSSVSFRDGTVQEAWMRQLPVNLPPMQRHSSGGRIRDVVFFCISFAAVFGAAFLVLGWIS